MERIGRTGFIFLTASALVIGVLGIIVTAMAVPVGLVMVLGLLMITLSLGTLFMAPFLREPRAAPEGWTETEEPTFEPAATFEPVPDWPEPTVEPVAAPAAPEPVAPRPTPVVNPPISTEWPEERRRRPASVTGGPSPQVQYLQQKYTHDAPTVGAVLTRKGRMAQEAPTVVAEVVNATALEEEWPEGMVKGRCGTCHTALLAPTARPINLRCPSCGKTTLLD